jgi:23S rRNA (pseudouridine1915-N3)-methyltransferase
MKLLLIAVGHKPPAWADAGYEEYARRFPREMPLLLKAIKAEPRGSGNGTGKPAAALMAAEAVRIEAALGGHGSGLRRVALDERGTRLTTHALADRLQAWRQDGRDVALIVGGPDGLAPALRESADETLRLSDLTLPHAMVRVLLAEALYRAWTLTTGHPYHRD